MAEQATRGGKRLGAGRPAGTGKYGAPTVLMRIPLPMKEGVARYLTSKGHSVPLYATPVQAGYPSELGEAGEPERIHLFQHLASPGETFAVYAAGDSMIGAGIHSGDLLIVARGAQAPDGAIVIASLDGEFTVKRLRYREGQAWLLPENPEYGPIAVEPDREVAIWGVVTHCIHAVR